MTALHTAAVTLVIGGSAVVLLLALTLGFRAVQRRRAQRVAARADTPLRRAARQHEARLGESREMHWVPDDHSGGWHLVGSYLPGTGQVTPASPPSRRRRNR